MRRKIIRVGSSRGVLIPSPVTQAMGWEFGSLTELTVDQENNRLILETHQVEVPDELDEGQLTEISSLAEENKNLLEEIND